MTLKSDINIAVWFKLFFNVHCSSLMHDAASLRQPDAVTFPRTPPEHPDFCLEDPLVAERSEDLK